MGGLAIDLSGGFMPKAQQQGQGVDLSGGFVPKASTQTSSPSQQGFASSFAGASGLSMLGHALMHPIDTAVTVLDAGRRVVAPNQPANMSDNPNPIISGVGKAIDYSKQSLHNAAVDYANQGLSRQTGRDLVGAIPVVGAGVQHAWDQEDAGNRGGAAGTALGLGFSLAVPHLLSDVKVPSFGGAADAVKTFAQDPKGTIVDAVTAPLTADLDKPIPGQNITPRQRYQAAQRVGVQLDRADATNSGALKMVKASTHASLAGEPVYADAKAANASALQGSTNNLLDSMYTGDPESGGRAIQSALRANQQGLQTGATEGFLSLPRDASLPGSVDVGRLAQDIQNRQAPYLAQFPSLAPNKALSVVDDAAGLAPRRLPPGVQGPLTQPVPSNFGTMQQLRSDLLDLSRRDPDLVTNQSTGWYKQLARAADEAITNGQNGLSPEDQAIFRDANSKWSNLKQTYDDPSSPLYHAVRAPDPTNLYSGKGLGGRTPGVVRDLLPRLGQTVDNLTPEAVGALRRGVVEDTLGKTGDDLPNFNTFGRKWFNTPAPYRAELFTPEQNQTLNDLAGTSRVLGTDLNPSGSGKLLQKAAEAASVLHGNLLPFVHRPIANWMNDGASIDRMMMPRAQTPAISPPWAQPRLGQSGALQAVPLLPLRVPLPQAVPAFNVPAQTPAQENTPSVMPLPFGARDTSLVARPDLLRAKPPRISLTPLRGLYARGDAS